MKATAVTALAAALVASPAVHSADVEAGRARVNQVCAACHGANGISVADAIPNLAGQKARYLEGQLKALKEGSRKNPVMNAIAAQLSADDIANVAAFYSTQAGGSATAKSDFLPNLAKGALAFPENYKASFVKYHTINFPETRQVRHYYANPVALAAAKDGKPLPNGAYLLAEVYSAKLDADKKPVTGADGFFVADQALFYTAMAREAGWGREVPEMLRNDEWNYGVFALNKQHRPGVNQAECLACHKPLDKTSYTFTLKELATAARAR